jgi:glycolate oxidase
MLGKLKDIVGKENFSASKEDLISYSKDFSHYEVLPLAIVRPKNAEQVIKIVKFARDNRLSLIPRGAGTNTCGQTVGSGIIIDMTQMNKILEINEKDFYCIVQPGVVLDELNRELRFKGLFFPPDPASSKACTIGGMVANNSSGLHAVKYGVTKDYVLSLKVVLPNGEMIKTGSLASKSSSGYNLTRLLVGSEGTLGIFTEIALRILPLPESSRTLVFGLHSVEQAEPLVQEILRESSPAALEIMDEICVFSLRKRYNLDFSREVLLAVEFQGSTEEVERGINSIEKLGSTIEMREDIWEYRKKLVPALMNYRKGAIPYAVTEDIGVPISMVVEAILKIKTIYREAGFEVAVYGHCGDGNLHMRVFSDENAFQELIEISGKVYDYVLSIGGTITAEHGVGMLRSGYLIKEHGKAYGLMKKIKKAIDPDSIMNPGKILEEV